MYIYIDIYIYIYIDIDIDTAIVPKYIMTNKHAKKSTIIMPSSHEARHPKGDPLETQHVHLHALRDVWLAEVQQIHALGEAEKTTMWSTNNG